MTDVESKPSKPKSQTDRSEQARALVRELELLRRLAVQLHKRASTGDTQALRAILCKREAVLDSICGLLASAEEPSTDAGQTGSATGAKTEESSFAQVLGEIAAADAVSYQRLQAHADKTAEEIHKLRAGKKWRESSLKW